MEQSPRNKWFTTVNCFPPDVLVLPATLLALNFILIRNLVQFAPASTHHNTAWSPYCSVSCGRMSVHCHLVWNSTSSLSNNYTIFSPCIVLPSSLKDFKLLINVVIWLRLLTVLVQVWFFTLVTHTYVIFVTFVWIYLARVTFISDDCGMNMISLKWIQEADYSYGRNCCSIMPVCLHFVLVYIVNLDKSPSCTMVYTERYQTVLYCVTLHCITLCYSI